MSSASVWKVLCFILFSIVTVSGIALAGMNTPIQIHQLPENPESPVISLDFKGGLKPRQPNNPHLLITSSGEGFLGSPYGVSQPINFKISQDEIQDILKFIIDENHFFSFDPDAVQEKIDEELNKPIAGDNKNSKRVFAVADAPTILIRVEADGRDHTVEYYALTFAARQFPNITELQQLLTIQKRLQHLTSVIRAGGEQALVPYLDTANSMIQKRWPGTPLFSVTDLVYTTLLKSGEKRLRFKVKNENPSDKTYRAVEVVQLPGKAPQYEIIGQ